MDCINWKLMWVCWTPWRLSWHLGCYSPNRLNVNLKGQPNNSKWYSTITHVNFHWYNPLLLFFSLSHYADGEQHYFFQGSHSREKIKRLVLETEYGTSVNRLWTTEWWKQGFIRIIDAGESCQKTVAKIAVPNPSSGWWAGQDLTWRLCRSTQLTRGFIRSQLPVVNHCLHIASHHRLLNLTFKKVVVVISSTETGRNNYESLYFIL